LKSKRVKQRDYREDLQVTGLFRKLEKSNYEIPGNYSFMGLLPAKFYDQLLPE
jgi:hypothetical protein